MPTFDCSGCGKSIRVADQYAGKRVKCPGCQAPQRVPGGAASGTQASVDLSGLDDAGGSSVRRLRQILIGCGACQKTIKLPEGRMGGNAACPKCGTMLQFDRFDLSKAKGDLIDMTHLELEPGDPLMDTGGYGSTLGGSAVSFGSAAGRSTSASSSTGSQRSLGSSHAAAAGLGGTSSDSQTQMRELRELNELKHSGAISNDEYKRRKAEIYSGKTLALQAMSRSADGTGGDRPALGRATGGIPPLVKGLVGAAVLGLAAVVVYATVIAPPADSGSTSTPADNTSDAVASTGSEVSATADPAAADAASGQAPASDETPPALATAAAGSTQDVAVADSTGSTPPPAADDEAAEETTPPPGSALAGAPAMPPAAGAAGANGSTPAPDDTADSGVSLVDSGSSPEAGDPSAVAVVEELPPPPPEMQVSDWPVMWEDHVPTMNQPIAQACDKVKRIVLRNDSALIGVSVGQPAETLDDPAYVMYRRAMTDILLEAADAEGVRDSLMVRDSDETFRVGDLTCQVVRASMRGRSDQAAIITSIQDGYSVSYWFAGSRRAYSMFLDTVGKAVLTPKI